jgi:protocatechuate 3,4-dioxygenase beta subunit
MKPMLSAFLFLIAAAGCNGQGRQTTAPTAPAKPSGRIGGPCDGCELMYAGLPAQVDAIDTTAAWQGPAPRLLVEGTVYRPDGHTPAAGILIHYWHTDATGHYTRIPGDTSAARSHGRLRGWLRTDARGHYAIYTGRPAAYPGRNIPAHIHFTLREPALANEYYIDELEFSDDPLLTPALRRSREGRGGSGIVTATESGGIQHVRRDIILGRNIPQYPR